MARAAGNNAVRIDSTAAMRYTLGVLAGSLLMVVLHPVVGLPLAAAAMAGLAYGGRGWWAVLAAAAGGALATLVGHATVYVVVLPLIGVELGASSPLAYAAMSVVSLLLVGPVAAWHMRSASAYRTMLLIAVGLSALQVITLTVFASGAGQSLQAFVAASVAAMAEQAGALSEMQDAVTAAWPGLLVSMNGFVAFLAVAIVGRAGVRRGVAVRPLPPLARIDLDVRATVLPIVAIALLAAGRLDLTIAPTLNAVGLNALIVARWVFFLQGVAVFAGLYERAGFPRLTRSLGYALLGVTEALVPLVSLTGLVDVWLNMRRLPRDGAAAPSVEAPDDRD